MTKWTNATGLATAYGCARQWTAFVLARGDIPEAVRPVVTAEGKTSWRIPLGAANRWLREQGVEPPEWELVSGEPGHWGAVWMPKTG